jgi:hypothetical protein
MWICMSSNNVKILLRILLGNHRELTHNGCFQLYFDLISHNENALLAKRTCQSVKEGQSGRFAARHQFIELVRSLYNVVR